MEILKKNKIEPRVIHYLEKPPNQEELTALLKKLDMTPREILRKTEDEYKINNLSDKSIADSELIKIMLRFPKLIERPIVVKGQKAIIGRPPENVLNLI
mgnify:CR=1 FL=1|tara:strand:+ start:185 stop:481 length:297 start_codon:yes stop_codon:yes gene_type:complete